MDKKEREGRMLYNIYLQTTRYQKMVALKRRMMRRRPKP